MTKHLTSEQMDALLVGREEAVAKAHAHECLRCAAELDDLRRLFGNLRQSTTLASEKQWGLAQRNTGVGTTIRAPRRAWAFALVAAALVCVVTPAELHRRHEASAERERVQRAAILAQRQQDQMAQLADEALLNSVQNDLSLSVPQPLQPLTATMTSTDETTSSKRTNP